jgi:hypothetical protein
MLWIRLSDIEVIMKTTRRTRCTTTRVLGTTCLTKSLWFPGKWRKTKKKREKLNKFPFLWEVFVPVSIDPGY